MSLCLFVLCGRAEAIDQVQLNWGSIESGAWRLDDTRLLVDGSDPQRLAVTVEVGSLEIGAYQFRSLRLSCLAVELLPGEVDCRRGELSLSSDWFSAAAVPAEFSYDFNSRQLRFSVAELPLAGGKVRLAFHQAGGGWLLTAGFADALPGRIAELAARAGLKPPKLDYQGSFSGQLAGRGDGGGLQRVSWELQTRDGGYSNKDGSHAAEALVLTSKGSATAQGDDWLVQAALSANQGMLYAEPLYLEFAGKRKLELSADMRWRPAKGELLLQSLAFSQPEVVTGSLEAILVPSADKPLRQLALEIRQGWLPGLYDTWLQPWLVGKVLEKLDTEGSLRGSLTLVDGQPQAARLILDQVSFREQSGQFGVQALSGNLRWDNSDAVNQSSLRWQGASFHRLQLGAAALELETGRNSLKIRHPLQVSLLDGQLHVDEFELGMEDAGLRWLLDGMLTPVSMQAFSTALGWPPLSGKLSGMVPKVRYEKGQLTLGGVLLVQAFDGDITVRNLRIQQPLGLVPRLWADVRLDHLDLKTLTETFAFGRIEGRLGGKVDGLYMEAWQPVAFDAAFATPVDDRSRRRISQKAVDNISDLGGAGVAGAVSRSFLRFLEDFPYQSLGISCRLQAGVCHMDGVAPAQGGYYLVQGQWLPPRLDVIGYAAEVDWQSLVGRLKAITASEMPVVE